MEPAASPSDPLEIGGYEVLDRIGTGGMSSVYRGIQTSLDRTVAIKFLSTEWVDDPGILDRFQRESVIIAKLNHPGIVRVIDRGVTRDGRPYFVMEHVAGADLSSLIDAGSLEISQKLDIIVQVCKALSYAHRNGVIHRDIKPANVILDEQGHARVLDFGIAKVTRNDRRDQTVADIVVGTPSYMSPEQLSGAHKLTERTDLYSLGVLMYELFTGRKPTGRFPPPSQVDRRLPVALDRIIDRCLQIEPADRFASADEIKDRVLALMPGAHLETAQRERTRKDLGVVDGKFTLLDVIKKARHSSAYLYMDNRDQRLLVIKQVSSTRNGLAEAKAMIRLDHPNLVRVFGVSGSQRRYIVVMEYLNGGSLQERLLRSFRPSEALQIIRDVLAGLAHAHSQRIVHGNLRPSNILFTSSGRVRVSDFGSSEQVDSDANINRYNPWKLPPTQTADLVAAGCVLYEMVSGSLPEPKNGELVPSAGFGAVPAPVRDLTLRMIGNATGKRFAGCPDAVAAIDRISIDWEEGDPTAEKTERFVAAVPAASSSRPGRSPLRTRTTLLLLLLVAAAGLYLTVTDHGGFWLDWIARVLD